MRQVIPQSSGFWLPGFLCAGCLVLASCGQANQAQSGKSSAAEQPSSDDDENKGDRRSRSADAVDPGPAPKPAEPTVAELIDRLTTVSEEGIGFHSTAWSSGFIALDDEEPEFGGGVLGSKKPVVSPVMQQIVRRGVDALPELIAHLTDKRDTKLVVGGGIMLSWYDTEYAGRRRTSFGWSVTPTVDLPKAPTKYRIRVGDLCYVAIGQIVNRNLSCVRYQPTACMVINSPVEAPALAKAVKDDWAGLTADEHRESLVADCLDATPYADWGAWQRIRFYYPELAEETALKLLARPLYDHSKLWDFIQNELVKEQDESKWRGLIDKYIKENGECVKEVLPFWMYWIYWDTDFGDTPKHVAGRATAQKILAKLYPNFDRYKPAFLNAADLDDQSAAVEALASYSSKRIDDTVYELLQKGIDFEVVEREQYKFWSLADACLSRLGKVRYQIKGKPNALLKQIRKIIAAAPKKTAQATGTDGKPADGGGHCGSNGRTPRADKSTVTSEDSDDGPGHCRPHCRKTGADDSRSVPESRAVWRNLLRKSKSPPNPIKAVVWWLSARDRT
jgi:hypothetical protein